jgi:hypothetical protein
MNAQLISKAGGSIILATGFIVLIAKIKGTSVLFEHFNQKKYNLPILPQV